MTTVATETVRAYDPTGHARIVPVEPAPRPQSLEGLRPDILTNRKMNARLLLESMVGELAGNVSLAGEPTVESKPSNGPPIQRMIDSISQNSDFAIVGTSD